MKLSTKCYQSMHSITVKDTHNYYWSSLDFETFMFVPYVEALTNFLSYKNEKYPGI